MQANNFVFATRSKEKMIPSFAQSPLVFLSIVLASTMSLHRALLVIQTTSLCTVSQTSETRSVTTIYVLSRTILLMASTLIAAPQELLIKSVKLWLRLRWMLTILKLRWIIQVFRRLDPSLNDASVTRKETVTSPVLALTLSQNSTAVFKPRSLSTMITQS